MRIVKFNNGTFGIRRWTLFWYEYLDRATYDWWHLKNNIERYCQMSQDEVCKRFVNIKEERKRHKAKTACTPVKFKNICQ